MQVEVGSIERAPVSFGDDDVVWVLGQVVDEVMPIRRCCAGGLLESRAVGPARGSRTMLRCQPDEHDGQSTAPEYGGKLRGMFDGEPRGRGPRDGLLQVDEYQGGI